VALAALPGCDTSGSGPNDDAPTVVAPGAFDLSDATFPEGANAQGGANANWTNAALRVGLVTLAVKVHLVVPQLATAAALQADPFVEDGTWIWANTVRINQTDVTFRLEGTPEGQEVDWRMIISTDEELSGARYANFVLYTGTTSLDGREGEWQLYYDIEGERTQVLTADFDVTSSTVRELTFRVPETNPNPDARGATIRYARDGDARAFDVHEADPARTHAVEWSGSTHAGSLTAWNYNGGARACWDASLQDVECGPVTAP
jgi:hypothetical protein